MLADVDTAVSVRYVVSLDDQELGAFSTCEGLGVEVVMETREEGGNNASVWQLPTRLKYPNIKLTRPLGKDTEKVAKWFATHGDRLQARRPAPSRRCAPTARSIAQWGLLDVVPVRWTGPSLNPDQPKIVTETIEIAHHGFLSPGGTQ